MNLVISNGLNALFNVVLIESEIFRSIKPNCKYFVAFCFFTLLYVGLQVILHFRKLEDTLNQNHKP